MPNHSKRQLNKAFTLYELIITIALFTLVAGLVISFITIMSSFTQKNEKIGARVQQITDVRKEVDYWFSYFDQADCVIEIVNDEESGLCVRAYDKYGDEYGLYLALRARSKEDEDDAPLIKSLVTQYPIYASHGKKIDFIRPNGAHFPMREHIVFSADLSMLHCYESNEPWVQPEESETDIRFIVNARVTKRTFAFVVDFGY